LAEYRISKKQRQKGQYFSEEIFVKIKMAILSDIKKADRK